MLAMDPSESSRKSARSELIRWLAEQLVANALAEGRLETAAPSAHEKRRHLRPVLIRPATRNLD